MLNAARLSGQEDHEGAPPLGQETAEAEHVVSHGSYLKNLGVLGKLLVGGFVNFLAFVALFLWAGTMVSAAVALAGALRITAPASRTWQIVFAVAFLAGARVALRGLYIAGGAARVVLPLAGSAVMVATAPSLVVALERVGALSEISWWWSGWGPLLVLGVGALVVVLSLGLGRVTPHGQGRRVAAWFVGRLPAFLGAVLFCLVVTAIAPRLERGSASDATAHESVVAGVILAASLVGAYLMQVLARTSLHGMYRDSLATCFSIRRAEGGVEPVAATAQKLSELTPPEVGTRGSFPRLLVCATANVIWDSDHPGRSPLFRLRTNRTRRFASFVYSHDRCGIPGVPSASVATTDLEKLTTRSGIGEGQEPLVSLMTAVASTGAAVSPAMGRRSSNVLRTLFALTNVRLGRWLPNPLSSRVRAELEADDADRRMHRHRGIGGAYDEFVPELFGLHQSDAARVYISDGGHYDNLGLLALLRARCSEIWCVDAQADPQGEAGQLRNVLELASAELGIAIDIDLSGFAATANGVLGAGHASGAIHYPDAANTGRLTVIKLGLVGDDSNDLFAYQAVDPGFAHHSTFWPPLRVMWYGRERFDKYREVGYANALAASTAP
jgi:hypothetical protein